MAIQPFADDPIRLPSAAVMPTPQNNDELFTLVVQTSNILVGELGPVPLHGIFKIRPLVVSDIVGDIHEFLPQKVGAHMQPPFGQPGG